MVKTDYAMMHSTRPSTDFPCRETVLNFNQEELTVGLNPEPPTKCKKQNDLTVTMEEVLANKSCPPVSYKSFKGFLKSLYTDENIDFVAETQHFLDRCAGVLQSFRSLSESVDSSAVERAGPVVEGFVATAGRIIDLYIKAGSEKEVNISSLQRQHCTKSFEGIKKDWAAEKNGSKQAPAASSEAESIRKLELAIKFLDRLGPLFGESHREITMLLRQNFVLFQEEITKNIPPSQMPIRIAISAVLLVIWTAVAVVMVFSSSVNRFYRSVLFFPAFVSFSFFESGQARICGIPSARGMRFDSYLKKYVAVSNELRALYLARLKVVGVKSLILAFVWTVLVVLSPFTDL